LLAHEKNITPRRVRTGIPGREFERAIEMGRRRSQFAALPEQRPKQVMRIGIVRFELQHIAVRKFRTFCISGALAPVSTL
jgi:hypothetical protein